MSVDLDRNEAREIAAERGSLGYGYAPETKPEAPKPLPMNLNASESTAPAAALPHPPVETLAGGLNIAASIVRRCLPHAREYLDNGEEFEIRVRLKPDAKKPGKFCAQITASGLIDRHQIAFIPGMKIEEISP